MTSWGYIGTGALNLVLGFFLLTIAGFDISDGPGLIVGGLGIVALIVGGFMVQVGTIAEGVRVGVSSARPAAAPRATAPAAQWPDPRP